MTTTQRNFLGKILPWRRKKEIKSEDRELSGLLCNADARTPIKTRSFDSMGVISSASSEFNPDFLILSLHETGTVTASVSSNLEKLLLMPSTSLSNNSDDVTQASSLLTTYSAVPNKSESSPSNENQNCFDDMSAISAEMDPPVLLPQEKHLVEWEFSPKISGWYSGPLLNNEVPHGRGTCVLDNGDKYEGPFYHGKMHGPSATLYKTDGSVYMGDVFNNLPHGFGTQRTLCRRYVGQFECGLAHGEGTLYYLDGSIEYDGEWVLGETVVSLEQLDPVMLSELVAPVPLSQFFEEIQKNDKEKCGFDTPGEID